MRRHLLREGGVAHMTLEAIANDGEGCLLAITGLAPGSRVSVFQDSDGRELLDVSESGTRVDFRHDGTTRKVWIAVMHLHLHRTWASYGVELGRANTSVSISQAFDSNFHSP